MSESPRAVTGEEGEEPRRRRGMDRREALRRVGGGGLTVLGAGVVVGSVGTHAVSHARSAGAMTGPVAEAGVVGHGDGVVYGGGADGRLSGDLPAGDAAGPYGGPYAAPSGLAADALDALTVPPPPRTGTVEVDLSVVEQPHQISRAHAIDAWTYAGSVPGPIIRATEGETIRVRFANRTGHDHNVHFHGRHSPLVDGWEPVPPGSEVVYELTAGPAGVHPYHCHTMPIDAHIARGLYGTLIVDPPGGRPDAHEVVLLLSGFDVDGDGRNEVYAWNGVAGFYERYPIKVPTGEPVRAYVLNAVEYDPVASFHLHAQTFDVYPAGVGDAPASHTDVITLGQMDRAILEFTLPEIGRYMFHPHQHSIAGRGAMGWFAAI
ncbi:multicopper oxidase domain-containing protein [Euzebya sp.]|uniref:multicopper oxidase domain-containing protein n=1 Tax=Euzebya sp. TaxID=1971409 RepID=UPI003517017D